LPRSWLPSRLPRNTLGRRKRRIRRKTALVLGFGVANLWRTVANRGEEKPATRAGVLVEPVRTLQDKLFLKSAPDRLADLSCVDRIIVESAHDGPRQLLDSH